MLNDLLKKDNEEEGTDEYKLDQKVQEIAIKEKEAETENKAIASGLPYINLSGFAVSPETLAIISEERARELRTICFLNTGSEIRLGVVDYDEHEASWKTNKKNPMAISPFT